MKLEEVLPALRSGFMIRKESWPITIGLYKDSKDITECRIRYIPTGQPIGGLLEEDILADNWIIK